MEEVYVGFDVHRKRTVYVVQKENGDIFAEGSIPTHRDGVVNFALEHGLKPGTKVCMECGPQMAIICDALEELELVPVVVDAAEVRRKARRRGQKTDRRDAFEICDGLRRDRWDSIVYVPPPHIRRLRRILSRRRHFVKLSTQQINAAKFMLRAETLFSDEEISLTTDAAWSKLLARKPAKHIREYLKLHAKTWKLAAEHIALMEKELNDALKPVAEIMDWLTSIPGIGLITASAFIATVGDPTRFPDSSHLVSYFGLAPSMNDTGDSERHGHITKAGSPYMRSLLCEVAQQTGRMSHPLNPYFVRANAKKGYKKAAISMAQRLARIMYRIWLNGERFNASKLNVERDGKPRTKRYHWKIKKTG